jgi:hypothetical protein
MPERAGSSIALVFPKQSDVSTGKEWVSGERYASVSADPSLKAAHLTSVQFHVKQQK